MLTTEAVRLVSLAARLGPIALGECLLITDVGPRESVRSGLKRVADIVDKEVVAAGLVLLIAERAIAAR